MICVSLVTSVLDPPPGLRTPRRTGSPSPAATANGATRMPSTTELTSSHGPCPWRGLNLLIPCMTTSSLVIPPRGTTSGSSGSCPVCGVAPRKQQSAHGHEDEHGQRHDRLGRREVVEAAAERRV